MARRKGALAPIPNTKRALDVGATRLAIAKHLTSLTSMHNVNMAVFQAQVYEQECINTLMGFVRDEEMPPALRRQCSLDVLLYARGAIKPFAHAGNTINPSEQGESGNTVGDEITAARNTTALYEKFDKLVAAGVHPDDWPDDVRQIAGELIDHYSVVGTIIDG